MCATVFGAWKEPCGKSWVKQRLWNEGALARFSNAVVTCIVLLIVAGCATESTVLKEPLPGSVDDARSRVAALDWSKAKSVTISLSEFSFTPEKFEFQQGIPYQLRLENKGDREHDFTSEGFFKAVAVQKLSSRKGDVISPYLRKVVLKPKSVKELYFVAVKPGSYDLECSVFLHAVFGMEGRIIVL